jgi:hypothetical protein
VHPSASFAMVPCSSVVLHTGHIETLQLPVATSLCQPESQVHVPLPVFPFAHAPWPEHVPPPGQRRHVSPCSADPVMDALTFPKYPGFPKSVDCKQSLQATRFLLSVPPYPSLQRHSPSLEFGPPLVSHAPCP